MILMRPHGRTALRYHGPVRLLRIALVLLGSLAALALLGAVAVVGRHFAQRPGRAVFVGGPVLTMDARDTLASGIALDGERIALVGDEKQVREWSERNGAEVVELEGRVVLPGFIDAHGHFPGKGQRGQSTSSILLYSLPISGSPLSTNSDIHLPFRVSASPISNQIPLQLEQRSTVMLRP